MKERGLGKEQRYEAEGLEQHATSRSAIFDSSKPRAEDLVARETTARRSWEAKRKDLAAKKIEGNRSPLNILS